MTESMSAKKICLSAMSVALVCIATMFFKIPIPLGYAHLGNAFILLGCALLGNPYAIIIGGVGSAMADLLGGYGEWILPTLLIKSLMGFVVGWIACPQGTMAKIHSVRMALACTFGIAIMILGYFLAGSLLYGSLAIGAAQIPGLLAEGIIGILLFYVLGTAFEKTKVPRRIG